MFANCQQLLKFRGQQKLRIILVTSFLWLNYGFPSQERGYCVRNHPPRSTSADSYGMIEISRTTTSEQHNLNRYDV